MQTQPAWRSRTSQQLAQAHCGVPSAASCEPWPDARSDVFHFFFQAEDGIRDHCVTGVQTCALPISVPADQELHPFFFSVGAEHETRGSRPGFFSTAGTAHASKREVFLLLAVGDSRINEIGRASCRERV